MPETNAPATLDAFRMLTASSGWLCVDPAYESAVRELGLPAPGAFSKLIDAAGGSHGRGATAVLALAGHAERLHLRPCRHGGVLAPWLGDRWLGRNRVRNEIDVTLRLLARGAPVPRPLLIAGVRQGLFWRTAVGTLHLEGARDGVALLSSPLDDAALHSAAEALGRAVRRFHDAGGWHPDLHLKNLMLDEEGLNGFVIDLDRARAAKPPPAARRTRELGRLTRSLLKRGVYERVGPEARLAFFNAYTGNDAEFARKLLATWPKEQRSIARHASGYGNS